MTILTREQQIERVYHAVVKAAGCNPRKTEYGIARAAFETMEKIRAEEDADREMVRKREDAAQRIDGMM